ncbi:MAG: AraC family transcriptional regulator [Bacteroidota bacterium]
MDPILEKVIPSSRHSFALKEDILPHIEIGWHFHPEYELTYFAESFGTMVVGDHITTFEAGEVLLLGPDLPHYMRNAERFYAGDVDKRCRAIVAHFGGDFLGEAFFKKPELFAIQQLLAKASQGLRLRGEIAIWVAPQMEKLLTLEGFSRLMCLLEILSEISQSEEWQPLASVAYTEKIASTEDPRIGKAFAFMFKHYAEEISLSELAAKVNMSESAFCKLIKRHTGKTFSRTLNEIRIGHACKLLIESSTPVGEIAHLCGFSRATYFNRKFKDLIAYSPLNYRKRFRA